MTSPTRTPTVADPANARAVWFTAPGQVELREENVGTPAADEILVQAITSLVSAGTEMHVYHGRAGSPEAVDLPTTAGVYPFPLKFAYQIVGKVIDAGERSGFTVGDRVFAMHPHQELFLMSTGPGESGHLMNGAGLAFPVPAAIDSERATFVNLFNVAYNALLDTPVRVGDVVVVSGLGVIGTFVAHLSRKTAGRLVLVDPIAERRERADWIGADAVVAPDEATDAIARLSDGRGSDIWFEASGAPAALQSAIDNTGNEGTITVVSFYGNSTVPLQLGRDFHLRRQRIVSSFVGAVGSGLQPRWDANRRFAVSMERLADFDIDRLVSHRIPFENAADAYKMIDENPKESLAVLLDYTELA